LRERRSCFSSVAPRVQCSGRALILATFLKLENLNYARLQVPIAIACGLVTSVLLGLLVGGAEFSRLERVGLLLLCVAYILFWQAHTWKVGLAVCFLGFSHIGFGFRISPIEMSYVVAFFLISISWWRKQRLVQPEVLNLFSFRVFNLALLAWIIYSGGHAIYTILDPFNPYEFALKNFMKTVAAMTGPPALVFYFMHRPRGVVADRNMPVPIVIIALVAIIINIAIRIWAMVHGVYSPEYASDLDETGYFQIRIVDGVEGPFTLRAISPIAGTTCAVLLGSKWLDTRSAMFRWTVYFLLFLSFVGAALSGGRATLVFTFVLGAAALWMRGHYRTVLSTIGIGLFLIIALNLIPGVLRSVPPIVQRSLQAVIFTQESEYAAATIASSSDWRLELVKRAFAEWRSDRRIFWFGRGTYKFGIEDIIAKKRNPGEGDMQVSLRRGATHSLVTDLLVVYGLVGLVVYFVMMVTLLWFLWRVFRHPSVDELGRLMTLICWLLLSFLFLYGIVGGANFPIEVAWLLVALFGYLYGRARGVTNGTSHIRQTWRASLTPRMTHAMAGAPLPPRRPMRRRFTESDERGR
jgi:O-antigen ligase